MKAARLGESGYVEFLHEVFWLGVITSEELIDHLALHGAVLRLDPALNDGMGVDEDALAGILRNLEVATAPLFDAFDRLAEISERVREDDR